MAKPFLALALLAAVTVVGACARPDAFEITPAVVERDRVARAALRESIAEDHDALIDLISSDRFAEPGALYGDSELRAVALRLVEQAGRLGRLDDTDVELPAQP